jgi:hypothetical protein
MESMQNRGRLSSQFELFITLHPKTGMPIPKMRALSWSLRSICRGLLHPDSSSGAVSRIFSKGCFSRLNERAEYLTFGDSDRGIFITP